jgi:hypothetical protein
MIMKRPLIIIFLASLVISISLNPGCRTTKNSERSPAGVTVRFLQYMGKFDFEEARKLGTEKTNRLIDMLDMLVEISKEKGADTIMKKKDIQVEIVKTAIDGNNAVVTYLNEQGKEQTMDLVKEKGKWLVDMKKEMPNLDGLQNKMMEQNQDKMKH